MRRVRARVFSVCVCVWVFRGRRESGGWRVLFLSEALVKRKEEEEFFFLFFSQNGAPWARATQRGKGRSDFGATKRRTRVRARARVRKREKLRVEFIKHHVVDSNKQNVIKKSDSVQVFSPSERG